MEARRTEDVMPKMPGIQLVDAVFKIAFVATGPTVVTWLSIREYWRDLYTAGTVPYYYAGSMALIRPLMVPFGIEAGRGLSRPPTGYKRPPGTAA